MKIIGFDWDEGNRQKCQKHGVSIMEIEFALSNTPIIAPDLKHSQDEARYIAIGRTVTGRHVFMSFTFRDKTGGRFIRPVHARFMHEKEIKAKAKATAGSHHKDG